MRRIAFYHLETLICIAEHGTFAAAAQQLNTTQPAISARMRELEAQLGTSLFQRAGRTMALTVQARQIVHDCAPLLAQIERSLCTANGFRTASGIVRIGAGEIAAVSCLPMFVTLLNAAMPRVSLAIEVDLTANLLQRLLSGATDIVFLAGPLDLPGVTTARIGSVDLLWLASPAIAARAKPADGPAPIWSPIWSLPHHSPIHDIAVEALRRADIDARSINSCNNVQTMIDIVAAGSGIGLFPASMARAAGRRFVGARAGRTGHAAAALRRGDTNRRAQRDRPRGGPPRRRSAHRGQTTRIARKSLTLVCVGPVRTRSPSASKAV